MHKKAIIIITLLLTFALTLGACGGSEGASASAGSPGAANEATKGWKELSYEGVSIVHPPEWEALEVPGGKIVSAPEKAAYIHMRLAPGEGPRISQTDEEALKQQYEASLSYEEPDIETFEQKEIDSAETIIAALTATEDEIGKDPETELIYYALIRRGDNAVTVLCTCNVKARAEFEAVFKQVVDSIAVG